MGGFPSKWMVEQAKKDYPAGTRVELVSMDDPHAPPVGTRGTVQAVDDIGTVHVAWDNGSCLGACLGEDQIRTVLNSMCVKCKKLNNECDGTENRLWNGCIYREA